MPGETTAAVRHACQIVGACSLRKPDALTKDIPVVMVSARGDKLDRDYALEMGADGYITKPFMSQELLEIVGNLVTSKSGA